MANIIDYALLNANKDFNTLPFSTIDGLILAQLSYMRYDGIVPDVKSRTKGVLFSDIVESDGYNRMFPLERTAERNKMLLNAVAYSKRYGKIRVNYYENIFDSSKDAQFCAVTFILENGDAYIAFRGTDSTITGWKENFNMLYMSPVASQTLSVPYVEKVARKTKGNLTLLGHSKGGNLAIYAAVMCSDTVRDRIIEIQSFDNPGFTEEFINSEKYLETESRISKLVPEESMIGMLLNNRGRYRVVKSDGVGFYQHDPFMWKIENNDFINADGVVTKARIIDGTFNEWVFGFSPEQREMFIEGLFNVIEATNAQNAATFAQWSENLKGNTTLILDAVKDLNPETRSLMLKVLGNLFVSAKDTVATTQKRIIKHKIKSIPLLSTANEQ